MWDYEVYAFYQKSRISYAFCLGFLSASRGTQVKIKAWKIRRAGRLLGIFSFWTTGSAGKSIRPHITLIKGDYLAYFRSGQRRAP
jgi:hypothetical protein